DGVVGGHRGEDLPVRGEGDPRHPFVVFMTPPAPRAYPLVDVPEPDTTPTGHGQHPPPGEKATSLGRDSSRRRRSSPQTGAQRMTWPSSAAAVARVRPSWSKAKRRTSCACPPKRSRSLPVGASQRRIRNQAPTARVFPSGENARQSKQLGKGRERKSSR